MYINHKTRMYAYRGVFAPPRVPLPFFGWTYKYYTVIILKTKGGQILLSEIYYKHIYPLRIEKNCFLYYRVLLAIIINKHLV